MVEYVYFIPFQEVNTYWMPTCSQRCSSHLVSVKHGGTSWYIPCGTDLNEESLIEFSNFRYFIPEATISAALTFRIKELDYC
jgi:hypothetical protein